MPRRNVLIAVVAVAAILAVGLTQLGGTSGSGGGGKAPTASQAAKRLAGSPPKLDALHRDADRLLPGRDLQARIAALKGYPIVLNVWGSWCVPCRQEFPVFQRVSAEVGKRVAFVGLVTQDPTDESRKFLASHPVTYPSYQDFDGSLAKSFGLLGTPSTIFYDAQGKKRFLHQGPYRKDADLLKAIERYTGA